MGIPVYSTFRHSEIMLLVMCVYIYIICMYIHIYIYNYIYIHLGLGQNLWLSIFSGMNIYLPAILKLGRSQGFDPQPYHGRFGSFRFQRAVKSWAARWLRCRAGAAYNVIDHLHSIYIYIYIFTHYIYIYVKMYVYIYMSVYIYIHIYIYICQCIYIYVSIHVYLLLKRQLQRSWDFWRCWALSSRSLPEVSRNLPVGLCEAKARCDAAASWEGNILQGSWLAKNRGIFHQPKIGGIPSGNLT